LGVFYFLIWDTRNVTGEILVKANLQLLIISILLWTSIHFIIPLFSASIFRGLSEQLSYHEAYDIHALRLPAKYLPGGIWHSIARIEGYHKHGIDKQHIALYLLIENISAAGITLLIGGAIVYFYIQNHNLLSILILGTVTSALILMVILPYIVDHNILQKNRRFSIGQYVIGLTIQILFWAVAGLSFYTFIKAVMEFNVDIDVDAIHIIGIYLVSWGIGFITLIAPQGLGVSEYIASQLLPHNMNTIVIISLLTGFRVVVLFGDILAWLLALLPFRKESLGKLTGN